MKYKVLWTAVGMILVLGLLAGSLGCAQPAAPGETTKTVTTTKTTTVTAPAKTVTTTKTVTAAAGVPEVFKWRLQSINTPGSGEFEVLNWMVDDIRAMSDGRLDITAYSSGELVPSMEIPDSLTQGVIEMGYSAGAYYTGMAPEVAFEGNGLPPFITRDAVDMLQLLNYWGLSDIISEAYAGLGVHLIGLPLAENAFTWSRDRLNSIEDLKGHKLRLWGGYVAKTFEKLGAVPAFIPHEEVYTALATGVIDGSGTGAGKYLSLGLYEYCPYIYTPPILAPATQAIMTDPKAWNALPDDLKEIVISAVYAMGVKWHIKARTDEEANIWSSEAQAKLGIEVVKWSDADLKVFSDAALSTLPELAAKSPLAADGVKIINAFMKSKGYIE